MIRIEIKSRKKAIWILSASVLGILVISIIILRHYLMELPRIDTLDEYRPNLITEIYDINGEVIDELFVERRALVPLSKIPVDLQNAVIAVEDQRFFKHWGADLHAIARAMLANLKHGQIVEGGSTITQQLAKALFLTREKTIERKIKELLLSMQLEKDYTKEEILQLYLNQVYFGQGAYGVQEASSIYFGKDIEELNLAESALLAGLPRAPNSYSPFVDVARAYRRRATVLHRMVECGFITEDEEKETNYYPLPFEKHQLKISQGSYFVEYVRQILEPKYGTNAIFKGGLKIYTTLDLKMQKIAEKVLAEKLDEFDEVKKRETGMPPQTELEETEKVPERRVQGAIIALDPATGQIRVMVGGRDFEESQFNRAVQAKRQPGSAFKPFIYTAAIDNGYTVMSPIEDSPVAYYNDGINWKLLSNTTDLSDIDPEIVKNINPENIWIPQNYEETFRGRISVRDALAYSINVCAVKILDRIRPTTAASYAKKMGIESPLEKTLSLALGSSVVTPLEITSAFGVLANQGIRTNPYAVIRVEDASGNVLEENFPEEKAVLSSQTAYIMTHLLKEVAERGTGWYTKIIGRPRAGKTGTTNEFTDAWFIGFVPNLVAGVWVGYDDNQTLGQRKSGAVAACPMWTEFMKEALQDTPVLEFSVPPNIVFVKIDPKTGLLALEDCPDAVLLPFVKGTEPADYFLSDKISEGETGLPFSPPLEEKPSWD
jgi:penicillin-binding protein 1A